MHRSFVSAKWLDEYLNDPTKPLPAEVYKRFCQIVRVKDHEEIEVFDGCGRALRALVDKKSQTLIKPVLRTEAQAPFQVLVLQAALSEDKIAQTIQRGSEFGVHKFIFFNAEHSENFCLHKLMHKRDRLTRIATDAARQCLRMYVAEMEFHQSLELALLSILHPTLGVYGDIDADLRLSQLLQGQSPPANFMIVVGPEGGLSDQEKAALKRAGFIGVSWAPHVLRSELASLAAVAIFNAFSGRA